MTVQLLTLPKPCQRHRVGPVMYLQNVYARLPTLLAEELPSLLPDQ